MLKKKKMSGKCRIFAASNNSTNPLTDNSPIFKSVKESASQLGLELEVEE